MTKPIKLTVVMTHPAQYFAPWFRFIAADCPELDLTVLYATQPTPEQQGVGFGRAFAWDVPLTEGYRCQVVRPSRETDNVHSDSFRGVDVPEIAEAIADTRPEVVLLSGWHSITQLRALWACRRLGVPVLYRGDTNLNSAPSGWRKPVWEAKTGFLLRQFAGYLAVGKRAHEYLRHFGASADRIFASPHCVDNRFFAEAAAEHKTPAGRMAARAAFGLGADDFVVLFAGKLEAKKRPLDLIRALAEGKHFSSTKPHEQDTKEGRREEGKEGRREGGEEGKRERGKEGIEGGFSLSPAVSPSHSLREPSCDFVERKRISLLVAGAGPLEAECRAEAERLGVRAAWAGFLNQTEIVRAFAAADCLALPSESETWGLAVNEALATGLPCIVSDRVGCAPDLISPGETGEVFPIGDVGELQAAIERVRQRIIAGHQYAAVCRAKADECSFAAATAGLLAACRAVTGSASGAAASG